MSTRPRGPAVNGFVLAGGKSSRMGRDKALLDWRGRTLLEHMVDLLTSATDLVRVVGRDQLPDQVTDCGPLGGILTALRISEADANLVVAVDLPLLTKEFLKYLRERLESSERGVVACEVEGKYPLCLGMKREVLPEVEQRLTQDRLSIRGFVDAVGPDLIHPPDLSDAGFDLAMFKNMNSENDFRS